MTNVSEETTGASAQSCDLWLRAGQEGCEPGKGGKAIALLLVSEPWPPALCPPDTGA